MHEGVSQPQAGKKTRLTLDQVKYCIRRFRQVRLKIFSADSTAAKPKLAKKAAPKRRPVASKPAARRAATATRAKVTSLTPKKPKPIKKKDAIAGKSSKKKNKSKVKGSAKRSKKK